MLGYTFAQNTAKKYDEPYISVGFELVSAVFCIIYVDCGHLFTYTNKNII